MRSLEPFSAFDTAASSGEFAAQLHMFEGSSSKQALQINACIRTAIKAREVSCKSMQQTRIPSFFIHAYVFMATTYHRSCFTSEKKKEKMDFSNRKKML